MLATSTNEASLLSVFSSPSRYTQGQDATAQLGQEMVTLGLTGPALIIGGRTPIRLLADRWRHSLGQAGIAYGIHPFGGECSRPEIEQGKQAARALSARVIIGAGGGKVLDAARAVASDLDLPIVNCPTVASSDAPCSALSVIYDEAGRFEQYRIYRKNPDLLLVDTQIIARSPRRLLVAGMGDALATWFEAKVCMAANRRNMRGGASTLTALALAELCYRTLVNDGVEAVASLERQTVTPALDRLIEANTLLSGLGFESSGLAAAHAVHNGLTLASGTHAYLHGEKVAFGLLVQLALENQPRSVIDPVLTIASQVGLPMTLEAIGIAEPTPTLLSQIADRATAPGETMHNEPFEVRPEMVVAAIRSADAMGRAWTGTAVGS